MRERVRRARRARPVVALVREAVERRRDRAVVLGEGSRAKRERYVDDLAQSRIARRLEADLVPHGPEEVRAIDQAAEAAVEGFGAVREIERHRDRDGADDRAGHGGFPLAEPLEQDVAAQRHAHRADTDGWLSPDDQPDDFVQIGGVPGVVERAEAIELAAARSEVQGDGAPAPGERLAREADDVVGARRAFEAVEHQHERRVGAGRVSPVEIDEVTVGGGDPLPPPPDPVTAEERAPDSLDVRVPAPPGRPERGRYSWPFSRSFATSGAISRARLSSSASLRFAIGCGIIRNL